MINPTAEFPFCPNQTDFLCFRSPDGFAAVDINLVEGFVAFESDSTNPMHRYLTRINLTNGSLYDAIETVPMLVARFAEVKKRRYAPERAETEIIKDNAIITPIAAPSPTPTIKTSPGGIWKRPGETT